MLDFFQAASDFFTYNFDTRFSKGKIHHVSILLVDFAT